MRALFDANIFVSFLLARDSTSPPVMVVEAALTQAYTLLMPSGVIHEIVTKTETKPYLASRISRAEMDRLIEALRIVGETIPELDEPLPEVGNDRKDDYLFAHALVGRTDYIVSGDRGVRIVQQIGTVKIVTPAEFAQILRENDRNQNGISSSSH